jgi:hypothetical protein
LVLLNAVPVSVTEASAEVALGCPSPSTLSNSTTVPLAVPASTGSTIAVAVTVALGCTSLVVVWLTKLGLLAVMVKLAPAMLTGTSVKR